MIDADVHPSCRPQIADLISKETPTKVLVEYADYTDVFSLILGLTNMLSN